jgi:hypothetical protein
MGKSKKPLRERLEAVAKKSVKTQAARTRKAARRAKAPPAAYRKAIVTFIDILGFKELLKTLPASDIHDVLSILADWSSGDLKDIDDDEAEGVIPVGLAGSIAFSDNVVRVCPIDSEEGGHGALFHELLSLVHVQAKLSERGIFLRGGLTVDDIYMSAGKVFGPGLVRAYELETMFAIYPRIVVDPATFQAYHEAPAMRGDHSVAEDLEYIEGLLRQGDDGLYFVDYLKACRSELRDPGTGFTGKLQQHARFITEQASKFDQLTTAKQKYLWLARYHNAVVRETEDADDQCLIDETALHFPALAAKAANVRALSKAEGKAKSAKPTKPNRQSPKLKT